MHFFLFAGLLAFGGGLQPVGFEENLGQSRDNSVFLKQTSAGWKVRFAPSGAMHFENGESWEWIGANANAQWRAVGPETSRVSYRLGRDASRWTADARCFAKIERRNHYRGIDLIVYESAGGEIEYDLKVQPGADLSQVRLKIHEGHMAGDGKVVTPGLVQEAPVSYQDGEGGRRIPVRSRLLDLGGGVFGIRADGYARNRELTVDPVIRARRVYVEAGAEERVIATFSNLTVGVTRSRSWLRPAGGSDADVFIESISQSGVRTVQFWGGSGDDVPVSVALQSFGMTIVGWTNSTDLPVSGNSVQQTYGGGASDGFVLSNPGSSEYATYIGGEADERLTGVAIGDSVLAFVGNIRSDATVTALANGTIPHNVGSSTGGADVLLGGLNSLSGTAWLTVMGGSKEDTASSIHYLGSDVFVAVGQTASADFPVVAALQEKLSGPSDGWLATVSIRRGIAPAVVQASFWGGSGRDRIRTIAPTPRPNFSDAPMRFVVGGSTDSSDFPGATGIPTRGGLDGFVSEFQVGNNTLSAVYSNTFGGSGDDEVLTIAPQNTYTELLVGGVTNSPNLQSGGNAMQTGPGGGEDAFVAQLDTRGNLVWASVFGGTGNDRVNALALAGFSANHSGGARLLVGGESNSATWLGDPAPVGDNGVHGFTFEFEFAYTQIAPRVLAGKNLVTEFAINQAIPNPESPLVRIRSADPTKLLVSNDGGRIGLPEVTTLNGAVQLLALDSTGAVDLLISGSAIPPRKVTVRLARTAVILSPVQGTIQPLNYVNVQATFAVIDPDTGKLTLGTPLPRPGLQAMVRIATSNEQGLRPRFEPEPANGSYYLRLDAFLEGTYRITVSSPLFETVPESTVEILVAKETVGRPAARRKFYLAKTGITPLTSNLVQVLEVTSSNPDKVKILSATDFSLQNSTTGVTPGLAVCVSDEGSSVVKAAGTESNFFREEVEIFCTPGYMQLPTAEFTLLVGGKADIPLVLVPDVATPEPGIELLQSSLRDFDAGKALLALQGTPARYAGFGSSFFSRQSTLSVEGARPGQLTLSLEPPPGVRAKGPLSVQVKVLPEAIRWNRDRNELRIGENTLQYITPDIQVSNRQVTMTAEIADTNIVQFTGFGAPDRTSALFSGVTLQAKGKVGSVTTITVTVGSQKFVTPVRIMPTVLVPLVPQVSLYGQSTIQLTPAYVEPETGRVIRSGYLDFYDRSRASLPVRVNASGDSCVFGETLEVNILTSSVAVACFGQGSVVARFSVPSGPFVEPPLSGSLQIRVEEPQPQVTQSRRVLAGKGLQVAEGSLCCTPQPPYKLTSLDPSRLLLSATQAGPGRATVEGVGPSQPLYLRALASEGLVQVRVEGTDGLADWWVHLYPSTIAFQTSTIDTALAPGTTAQLRTYVGAQLAAPDGEPLLAQNSQIAGFPPDAEPFLVRATSDRPQTAEQIPPTPLLSGQTWGNELGLRINGPGTAQLTLSQPEGFLSNRGVIVRVNRPRIALANEVILSKDLAMAAGFNLLPLGTPSTALTVTSLDPDKLLVAQSASETGKATVVTDSGQYRVYLQGLASEGKARVRVSATGLEDLEFSVELLPAATIVSRSSQMNFPGSSQSIFVRVSPVRGTQVPNDGNWIPVSGKAFVTRLRSTDPQVVRLVGSNEIRSDSFAGGSSFSIQLVRPGTAELELDADPRAPLLEASAARWQINVEPWQISLGLPNMVTRGIATALRWYDSITASERATAKLTAEPAGAAVFSLSPGGPWTSTLDVPPGRAQPYIAGASNGPAEVTVFLSGQDVRPEQAKVPIRPGQFLLNYPEGNIGLPLTQGRASIRVQLSSPSSYYGVEEAPLALGFASPVVTVRSSDPSVVAVTGGPLEFSAGVSRRDVSIQLLKKGTAILSVEVPSGFEASPSWGRILITVQ